jgi:hypothetical protein
MTIPGITFRQQVDGSYPELPSSQLKIIIDAHGLAFSENNKQVVFQVPKNVRIFSYTIPGKSTYVYEGGIAGELCQNTNHIINNTLSIIYEPEDIVADLILNTTKNPDDKPPFYAICGIRRVYLIRINGDQYIKLSEVINYLIKDHNEHSFDIHILSCQNLLVGEPDISSLYHQFSLLTLGDKSHRLISAEETKLWKEINDNIAKKYPGKIYHTLFDPNVFDKNVAGSNFGNNFFKKILLDIRYLNGIF